MVWCGQGLEKDGARPQLDQPPSMIWAVPVVKDDSSLARYTASAAISSARPRLWPLAWAWAWMRCCSEGDMTVPGQMALQRMPCPTKSAATDLVSPTTAALVVP